MRPRRDLVVAGEPGQDRQAGRVGRRPAGRAEPVRAAGPRSRPSRPSSGRPTGAARTARRAGRRHGRRSARAGRRRSAARPRCARSSGSGTGRGPTRPRTRTRPLLFAWRLADDGDRDPDRAAVPEPGAEVGMHGLRRADRGDRRCRPGGNGQRVDAPVPRVVGREDRAAPSPAAAAAPPAVEAAIAAGDRRGRTSLTSLVLGSLTRALEPSIGGGVVRGIARAHLVDERARARSATAGSWISSTFSAFCSPEREKLNEPTKVTSSATTTFACMKSCDRLRRPRRRRLARERRRGRGPCRSSGIFQALTPFVAHWWKTSSTCVSSITPATSQRCSFTISTSVREDRPRGQHRRGDPDPSPRPAEELRHAVRERVAVLRREPRAHLDAAVDVDRARLDAPACARRCRAATARRG